MNPRAIIVIASLFIGGTMIAYYLQPSQSEPGYGEPMVSVSLPRFSLLEKTGEELYNASCAACHGVDVRGQEGIAPSLIDAIYQPKFHADGAFYIAVQNGVRAHHYGFGSMPPIEGVDSEDVAAIIAYIRAIQRENGIE